MATSRPALFATPIVLGFVITAMARRWTISRLAGFAADGLVTMAIAAGYIVPLLVEGGDLNPAALTEGFDDFHQHFFSMSTLLHSEWFHNFAYAPDQGIACNLSSIQAIAIVVAAIWIMIAPVRHRRMFVATVISIGLLLWHETGSSALLWDRLPVARFLQFPHRVSI